MRHVFGPPGQPRAASRGWLDAAIAACLAPRCAVCDGALHTPSLDAVCGACWESVDTFTPPLCATCGSPLAASTRGGTGACALCATSPLHDVDRAAALGFHDGTLREVVHALKFGRRHGLARRLANALARMHPELIDGMDAAVPVPLHPGRHRARGFNQAQEIARHLGIPVWRAIRRARRGPPQSSLDGRARRVNATGAFALSRAVLARHALGQWRARGGRPLEGLRLVLVDDVWTTGATLSACAGVLREAGAREVTALVIARAVPSRLR